MHERRGNHSEGGNGDLAQSARDNLVVSLKTHPRTSSYVIENEDLFVETQNSDQVLSILYSVVPEDSRRWIGRLLAMFAPDHNRTSHKVKEIRAALERSEFEITEGY